MRDKYIHLVEDHVAHGLFLHVVVEIFVDQRGFLRQFLLAVTRCELQLDRSSIDSYSVLIFGKYKIPFKLNG